MSSFHFCSFFVGRLTVLRVSTPTFVYEFWMEPLCNSLALCVETFGFSNNTSQHLNTWNQLASVESYLILLEWFARIHYYLPKSCCDIKLLNMTFRDAHFLLRVSRFEFLCNKINCSFGVYFICMWLFITFWLRNNVWLPFLWSLQKSISHLYIFGSHLIIVWKSRNVKVVKVKTIAWCIHPRSECFNGSF